MNPATAVDPTAPPPPPPQPPRSSFSCDRHPTENFTGFCPSCLCERLTTLDNNSSSNTPSSSRRPSSAIKALFSSSSSKTNNFPPPPPPAKPSKPTSFLPEELRRSKSFSASKNEALGHFFEPQRKSCDVRGRNTLWTLFSLENDNKTGVSCANDNKPSSALASASSSSHQNPQISVKIKSSVANHPVFEETENEDFKDPAYIANDDDVGFVDDDDDDDDEIRPVSDSCLVVDNFVEVELNGGEIVEEEEVMSNLKPMKDHIDLDTQDKKSSGGVFWSAATVFSKKWQKWRRKQKIKKQNNDGNSAKLPVEKPISRQFRETQSEIADYGYGRRSCDIDPRFSLDAGRISLDDPRCSLEEPRASWDGYLMGRRSFSRMAPTMVSVMEDAPSSVVQVSRTDMQIPLEETKVDNDDESVPGGSTQTREYYSDSSRRRKSLDRSSSIRKTTASVVAEIDELKTVSNSKVPPTTADYFQGGRISVGERELRDSNSNSLRDDCSETFELGNGFRDVSNFNGERKESKKSRRPWGWRIWGFIQRRNNNNKDDDEDEKYSRVNGVERSYSESWRNGGDLRNRFNRNVFRSNSSVSWRNANHIGGPLASVRSSGFEMNGNGKKRDEFILEKNPSARYSPSHNNTDNGLLRFYMTPLRGSRRVGTDKIKPNGAQSIARSVLRMF